MSKDMREMAKKTDTAQRDYPSKLYYSISEVAKITGIKAHVLRYWETEFPTLKPKKTRSGSRRYRQKDIEEIEAIKILLYTEGFKIAGARKVRREARKKVAEEESPVAPQIALKLDGMTEQERISFVKNELIQVLELVRALKDSTSGEVKLKAKKGKA